ncbi:hypothetical protein ACFY7C_37385 [Streptomyces sp. NPDC012769]|uniref:hypothetical protein n=1 Tax=Streptomyces sp. NPDC012769 TaxID=3364848 RepID=UPI0036749838
MPAGGLPFELGVDAHEGLAALARAIRAEEDGKELRRELAKNMRTSLLPAAAMAKSGIMSMASAGPGTSPALRSSIARKIRPEVKLGGRWTGARIKAFKTKNVRGFPNAPKRTNRPRGWRHLVYGRPDTWVTQYGKTKWFDHAMDGVEPNAREAVERAMEDMAARLAARIR